MLTKPRLSYWVQNTKEENSSSQKILIADCTIALTDDTVVRNIGVWFDNELNMNSHVQKVCQSAPLQI